MRAKGITYDTGFVRNGGLSRERFDPDVVRRELGIIRDDLHRTAVRVIGGDPERLELAPGETLSLLADCAGRAERIRRQGAEVVFLAGHYHGSTR
ncbi:hypothetical protein [Nonomuraea sp. NPDC003214]